MTWNDTFDDLFEHCCTLYRSGRRDFEHFYNPEQRAFLASIGCQTREFFDFVEDYQEDGVPTPGTALLVAAVRRDYFLAIQKGVLSEAPKVGRAQVPSFDEEFEGIAYLPRIRAKAWAKLRGELDPDLMYGCGGDRRFLRQHGEIHPADFLRRVWAAGDDVATLAEWVREQAR
jgi:hypothetical protein